MTNIKNWSTSWKRVKTMTKNEIDALFQRIEELRDEIKNVEIPVAEEDHYKWDVAPLLRANSLIHQAEQTLLDANKWLGYFVMHSVKESEETKADGKGYLF